MRNVETIKTIKKLKGLTEQEKKYFITKGILEIIINSYKVVLKLPFYLVGYLFIVIGAGAEKIEDLFYFLSNFIENILYKIEKIKSINLCTKQEIDHLKKIIKEEHTYKVEVTDLKENIGDYENAKNFAEKQRKSFE